MASPKRKTSPTNTAALEGFTDQVDSLVAAHAALDAAQAKIEALRAQLDPIAIEERRALEAEGVRTKQITILGTGKPARYTFPDKYRPLPATVAADLAALLGADVFGRLFTPAESVRLRADVEISDLVRLFPALDGYTETVCTTVAVKGMGDERAKLRACLTEAQNATLDHVIEGISNNPSCSVK